MVYYNFNFLNMSYSDEELKIDVEEENEEEDLDSPLNDIPEEDDLLDDEFVGLSDDSEY